MITISQATVIALAITREDPTLLDHHIAEGIETASSLLEAAHYEYGYEYDFDTAFDRAFDFALDAKQREEQEDDADAPATFVDLCA